MAAKNEARAPRLRIWLAAAVVTALICWVCPPFHVKRLARLADRSAGAATGAFDAKAVAAAIWREKLPHAASVATDVGIVAAALRTDPERAKEKLGRVAGVGSAYFFVRGRGHIVSKERSRLIVAIDGTAGETVALRIGPVFGNIVRDGCGLLNLDSFPGLSEYNAISAELNALIETEVLPPARQKAQVGGALVFAGCAEAPDAAPESGEPAMTIVPVQLHCE